MIWASKDRPTVPTLEKSSEGRRARRGTKTTSFRKSVRIRENLFTPGRTRPKSSLGVCPLFPLQLFLLPGQHPPPPWAFPLGSRSASWGLFVTIGLVPMKRSYFYSLFNLLQTILTGEVDGCSISNAGCKGRGVGARKPDTRRGKSWERNRFTLQFREND